MAVKIVIVRAMMLCMLYAFIAGFVLPYVAQDLPYSRFYSSSIKKDHDNLLVENSIRVQRAKAVLSRLNCAGDCWRRINRMNKNPEFCFVIITVSRPAQINFLTQVVAGLVSQLSPKKSVFSIFNAEGPSHQEAVNLSSSVPVYSNKKVLKQSLSKFIKEKEDYVKALEWCHAKNATFSVILEDDALPLHDFMERLQFILDYRMNKASKNWMLLKLYYPEKWQGWSNEREVISELILVSILGGLLLVILAYAVDCLVSLTPASYCETVFRFLLSAALVSYVLFGIGRPHWIALRQFSTHLSSVVVAPGCCTPAVLYPRTHLKDVILGLRSQSSNSHNVDIALDNIAIETGLTNYLAIPNLVSHIGFVSSLGKGWKNPREFQHL